MLGEVRHHGYLNLRTHPSDISCNSPQASDAPKVSEYLCAMYGELGLGMEFEPPAPTQSVTFSPQVHWRSICYTLSYFVRFAASTGEVI
jgi:hypothetical protein